MCCNVSKERCCLLKCFDVIFIKDAPGVGKSTFVQSHFRNFFLVGNGDTFFMHRFDDSYDAIVFDEFNAADFPRVTLYRLMDRIPVYLPQKHDSALLYKCNIPIVFLSNFDMPECPAFRRRVYYYEFAFHNFECEGCI